VKQIRVECVMRIIIIPPHLQNVHFVNTFTSVAAVVVIVNTKHFVLNIVSC